MKTLNTQPHSIVHRLGSRCFTALLTLCCCFGMLPASAQYYTVGTGTSTYSAISTMPAPLGYANGSGRMQYMWTKAELNAAGLVGARNITQFAFFVNALNNAGGNHVGQQNLKIMMMGTPLPTLSSTSYINLGSFANSVTVLDYTTNNRTYEPSLGWNIFNVPGAGYAWDGNENIVIDICYNNTFNPNSTSSNIYTGWGNCAVRYTSAPSTGTWSIYNTSSAGVSLCGATLTPSTTTTRPNIRFASMAPCVSAVNAGNLNFPATSAGPCPGSQIVLADTNYGSHVGMTYTWEYSNSPTGTFTAVPGALNEPRLQVPTFTEEVYYRLTMGCSFGGTGTISTTPVGFTTTTPVTYATVPFSESFETWINGCATNDKPGAYWTNIPATGNASARRNDQTATASWTYTVGSAPAAKVGSYMARINNFGYVYGSPYVTPGNDLSLHLDCSGTTGQKELRFWYCFKAPAQGAFSEVRVEMSQNGGMTFSPLTGATPTNPLSNFNATPTKWAYFNAPVNSNAAKTIIRIYSRNKVASTSTSGTNAENDFYIDGLEVVPPCSGKPVAGKIDSLLVCSTQSGTLTTTGTSKNAGLSYLWQSRPAGSSVAWAAMAGGNGPTVNVTMNGNLDIRLIVTCTNGTPASDTTPVYTLRPAPFYYCYCAVAPAAAQYVEIGNTTMVKESNKDTILNNGVGLPTYYNTNATNLGYEDFTKTVKAPELVLDSTYRIILRMATNYCCWWGTDIASAWIDFNRDGDFSDPGEKIMNDKSISNSTTPVQNQVFTVPATAMVGLTGMRVMIAYNYNPPSLCGTSSNTSSQQGQFEDYLVDIKYQPCTAPASAGTTYQSDTAVCPGYTVNLWNTDYQQDRTGIQRMWEVSTNNGSSFSAIPNSADKDSMINLVVGQATSSKYRLRLICKHSNDTTYSNVVTVNTPPPYRCYPTSWSMLGARDSSDIGTVIIGNRMFPATAAGPHLLNPAATKRRTDWTLEPPIELSADSTYRLAVFHTMPRQWHADAMVSVFFDYNADGDYDVTVPGAPFTSELAFQGISVRDSFFLDTKIKIPSAVIPNTLTGMRVVLNNNLDPNDSGNIGRGLFTSGEVEDYVVIFRRANVGVGTMTLLNNLGLYPNPTDGRFTVLNDAARAVNHMDIVVTTVSGQEVVRRSFDNVGTHFTTSLDLSNQAKGIYFVEIRADGEKVTKKLIVR
jgi:hypothetical protein